MFTKRNCKPFCLAAILIPAHCSGISRPIFSRILVQQIAEIMSQGPSGKAHQRYIHAKGIVCEGTFQASPQAREYFTRRASSGRKRAGNGCAFPMARRILAVADNSPDASPRGMAIRFEVGEEPTLWRFHITASWSAPARISSR